MPERKFYVGKDVLAIGVKILFVEIDGLDNTVESGAWKEYREGELKRLYEKYKDLDVHSDPVLEGFNLLHDHSGVKRRKNIPASENLIKLLKKGQGELFTINQAVDIYNLISLESKLALGAHDADRTSGNVTLRFTDGSEKFLPLGQKEPIPVNPHEYCYCDDDNEVLCRCEIRQVAKTAVNEQSKNVWYIVQGNEFTPDDLVRDTAEKVIVETEKWCGGKGRIIEPEVI